MVSVRDSSLSYRPARSLAQWCCGSPTAYSFHRFRRRAGAKRESLWLHAVARKLTVSAWAARYSFTSMEISPNLRRPFHITGPIDVIPSVPSEPARRLHSSKLR